MVGKVMRTDVNFIKEDWGLFFESSMAEAQMDQNYKIIIILAMEVEPVTVTDQKVWKWKDRRLDDTLGKRPTRSLVTRGNGTSHIDQSFWENYQI